MSYDKTPFAIAMFDELECASEANLPNFTDSSTQLSTLSVSDFDVLFNIIFKYYKNQNFKYSMYTLSFWAAVPIRDKVL